MFNLLLTLWISQFNTEYIVGMVIGDYCEVHRKDKSRLETSFISNNNFKKLFCLAYRVPTNILSSKQWKSDMVIGERGD